MPSRLPGSLLQGTQIMRPSAPRLPVWAAPKQQIWRSLRSLASGRRKVDRFGRMIDRPAPHAPRFRTGMSSQVEKRALGRALQPQLPADDLLHDLVGAAADRAEP